jgi:RHS repeat-associated protein
MKVQKTLYILFCIISVSTALRAQQSPCVQVASTPTASQNYIITNTIKRDSIFNESQISTLTNCELNQTVQYFDGLGRPLQSIQVKASPLGKDIIMPVAYDAFGRETIKYEPYADAGTANGSYRPSAVASQLNFYTAGVVPASIQANPAPFSKSVIESSPLNRVLEQGFPGTVWQPGASRTASSGRTVVTEYLINDTLDVPYIRLTPTGAIANTFYPGGKLYKTIFKDENWTTGKANTTEEYKDLQGRVILKKIWQTSTVSLSTFYVYDGLGNLRYVVPPFPGAPSVVSLNDEDDLVKKYCYVYRYDGRNRLIEKRIPGKEWEYIVYNKLDQVVLTQDGNQRPKRHWTFNKYDALGRVISTGIYRHATVAIRDTLQATVNRQTKLWETWAGNDYTAGAFPQTVYFFHQIFKYDSYDMPLPPAYLLSNGVSKRTKGLLVATMNFVNEAAQYLATVNYYDDYGRIIKTFKQHYASSAVSAANYDEITNIYNFSGEVKTSTRVHRKTGTANLTLAMTYDYDAWGRKIRAREKINAENEVVLSENLYNEIGGLKEKQLYGGLQKTTYAYNQRSWLKSMRSNEFTEVLMYEDSTTNKQYNGNISYQKWGYQVNTPGIFSYTYDGLNRLTNGTSNASSNSLSEIVTYDSMGNIVTMNRKGTTGTYTYSGNKLTKITGFAAQPYNYYYDANGNMTKNGRNLDSLTYNALNLPKSVTRAGQTVDYLYAMDGTKLRKIRSMNGVIDTTHYVDGIHYNGNNIEFIQTEEGIARRGASYIYAFNLMDHLGNVRRTFQKNPVTNLLEILQSDNYYAFGKRDVRTAGTNKYLYNGKELQEESETYDYGARYYDPVIARWSVIDKKAELYFQITPYAYAANTPTNAIDPDGHLVIFINGQHGGSGGTYKYWGSFADKVQAHFNDYPTLQQTKYQYYDGAQNGWGNTALSLRPTLQVSNNLDYEDRINAGNNRGKIDAGAIIRSLARTNGVITESIKIVAHSMGAAYAKGFINAIVKYAKSHPEEARGLSITEFDFAAFQQNKLSGIPGVTLYQFDNKGDNVVGGIFGLLNGSYHSKEKGREEKGSNDDVNPKGGHSISDFLSIINTLEEGSYKFINGNFIRQ